MSQLPARDQGLVTGRPCSRDVRKQDNKRVGPVLKKKNLFRQLLTAANQRDNHYERSQRQR